MDATLDVSNSYRQTEAATEGREKTAFALPSGLFQFNTLPMSLVNAAATCKRLMQAILKELVSARCLVYQDDVVVFETGHPDLLKKRA